MGNTGSLSNLPKVDRHMIGFETRQSAQRMFSVLHFISLLRESVLPSSCNLLWAGIVLQSVSEQPSHAARHLTCFSLTAGVSPTMWGHVDSDALSTEILVYNLPLYLAGTSPCLLLALRPFIVWLPPPCAEHLQDY